MILNKLTMKTKNYLFTILGFFAGLVSGVALIGLFGFADAPSSPAPAGGVTPVSATVANGYFRNYMADAAPLNAVIKGFSIDRTQLDAMNRLVSENAALIGFRVYMGKDNSDRKTGIVVGVDNTGKDAVKNTIFSTDSQISSPCPPVCDVNSPLIIEN